MPPSGHAARVGCARTTLMPVTQDDRKSLVDLYSEGRPQLAHLRGLDGLRGLAVAVVVAFHAGFGGMVGGYLGVSTFFTLSGFLIASLLFAGGSEQHGIVLRGFWGRRFRRLFPAAVATIIAVLALFAPFVATPDQLSTLRGDSLAALFNVANWRFILEGSSYGELFSAPSPLLHFWSLAIEEQFYLVFPLLLWVIIKAFGGRRMVVGGTLVALTAASLAWTLFGGLSDDHIYFGTFTRASELLLGAVLAVVMTRYRTRKALVDNAALRTTLVVAGAMVLALQAWWWWGLDQTTGWLYRGGFTGYAALTCLLIVSAAIPVGPVFRLLSVAPMRWLGSRSYAIYLVHWPLFLAARQTWGDANRWLTTAGVVAVSLLLAELSFRVLESPIRLKVRLAAPRRALAAMGAAALAVIVLAFTVVPNDPEGTRPDFEDELEQYRDLVASAPLGGGEEATTTTTEPPAEVEATAAEEPIAPPPVPVVGVYGDSTSLAMGIALARWGDATGRLGSIVGDLRFGCGVPRYVRFRAETVVEPNAECVAWPGRWTEFVNATDPDIVLLSSPAWTVPDAVIPGAGQYSAIGDPVVDDFIRDEFLAAVDILSSQGALVVLVNWPEYGSWYDDGKGGSVRNQADPARMARLHEIQREVAQLRPGSATVVEFAGWLGPRAQDPALRADGMHFTEEEFTRVTEEWFGAELERLWVERWEDLQALERSRREAEAAGASSSAAPGDATPGEQAFGGSDSAG